LADLAVAPDAQCFATQHLAETEVGGHRACFEARLLPSPVLEVADVLRQTTHGCHDQSPSQLGRRNRGARAFGYGNAAFGTSRHIDVASDLAGLRNEFELGEFVQQLACDVGALTNQHQYFGITQPHRQLANALDGVGVNLSGVGF